MSKYRRDNKTTTSYEWYSETQCCCGSTLDSEASNRRYERWMEKHEKCEPPPNWKGGNYCSQCGQKIG